MPFVYTPRYPDLSKFEHVGYDTETTGLKWYKDKMFAFIIATPDGWCEYYDIRRNPEALVWLRNQAPHIKHVICHLAKFDIHMSINEDVHFNPKAIDCTMVRESLCDETQYEYNLDAVLMRRFPDDPEYRKDNTIYEKLAEIFGGKATRSVQAKNFYKAPFELMHPYGIGDGKSLIDLWEKQQEIIEKQDLLKVVALERELTPILIDIERGGIRIDEDKVLKTIDELEIIVGDMRARLNKICGTKVNPNANPGLLDLFLPVLIGEHNEEHPDLNKFKCKDGSIIGATPKGNPSLSAVALKEISKNLPEAALILECREYMKVKDTFLRGHIMGNIHNGRVYPNINQTLGTEGGSITGRLSYNEPALQQIPSRNIKLAKLVRPCFLPDEGCVWYNGDLEQHEQRVCFHYVNNKDIVDKYVSNPYIDAHQMVSEMMHVPRSKKTKDYQKLADREGITLEEAQERKGDAKTLNLAMIMGMGNGTVANDLGLPWEHAMFSKKEKDKKTGKMRDVSFYYKKAGSEAMAVISKYHITFPGIKELQEQVRLAAQRRGYIKTIAGRRIRFRNKGECHKAPAVLFQGSSADLNKMNIIACWKVCQKYKEYKARFLLNIHDEYNISV